MAATALISASWPTTTRAAPAAVPLGGSGLEICWKYGGF